MYTSSCIKIVIHFLVVSLCAATGANSPLGKTDSDNEQKVEINFSKILERDAGLKKDKLRQTFKLPPLVSSPSNSLLVGQLYGKESGLNSNLLGDNWKYNKAFSVPGWKVKEVNFDMRT
jgi:hypothetical protein